MELSTTNWTNPDNESWILEALGSYNRTIIGTSPDVDFAFHDAVNSAVMGIACQLAMLEGDEPDPHSDERFIRYLMTSQVPPAVVLRWVCLALAADVPADINEAAERLRTKPRLRTYPAVRVFEVLRDEYLRGWNAGTDAVNLRSIISASMVNVADRLATSRGWEQEDIDDEGTPFLYPNDDDVMRALREPVPLATIFSALCESLDVEPPAIIQRALLLRDLN